MLPRLVGRARAAELALLGEPLPAAQAREMGLIYKCVAADTLGEETANLAGRLARGPTKAIGITKRNMYYVLQGTFAASLAVEAVGQCKAAITHDAKEGVDSFLSGRKPAFKGR